MALAVPACRRDWVMGTDLKYNDYKARRRTQHRPLHSRSMNTLREASVVVCVVVCARYLLVANNDY